MRVVAACLWLLLALADPSAAQFQFGTLSGRVTDAATNEPISNGSVVLFKASGQSAGGTPIDGNGFYQVSFLPTGLYYVKTLTPFFFVDELYDNIECDPSCDVTRGTPVVITAGATTTIDFALNLGGTITGVVTDRDTGAPIGASIEVFTSSGVRLFNSTAGSNSAGRYTVRGLATGSYFIRTNTIEAATGMIDELYDGIRCYRQSCDPTGGAPIAVTTGAETAGIDFALSRGAVITGRVTASATGQPLVNTWVDVFDVTGLDGRGTRTDATGGFVFSGLETDSYVLSTGVATGQNLINEVYDNFPCPPCLGATPVAAVEGSTTAGIDFALDAGAVITGRIVSEVPTIPIRFNSVEVHAYDVAGRFVRRTPIDGNGVFSVGQLPAGTFYIRTFTKTADPFAVHIDELFGDILCFPDCTPTDGTPIAVTAGMTKAGIDFVLTPGGSISGEVLGHGSAGVDGVLQLYSATGTLLRNTPIPSISTTGGRIPFKLVGLLGGSYRLRTKVAISSPFLDELHDDKPCVPECDVRLGTPIEVTVGADTTGINFNLTRASSAIFGIVTDALTGLGIQVGSVDFYDLSGAFMKTALITAGQYTVHVPPGTYFAKARGVGASTIDQYVPGLYDGRPCHACDVRTGTPIQVADGQTRTDVNFALIPGGGFRGTVTEFPGGRFVSTEMRVYTTAGVFVASKFGGGDYWFSGLPAGSYVVRTVNDSGYLDKFYANGSCPPCRIEDATPIVVSPGVFQTGVDFALQRGGRIAGRVTDAATGAGIADVTVGIYTADGLWVTDGDTNPLGDYVIGAGLLPGNYVARTFNSRGYRDEIHSGLTFCAPSCRVTDGTVISVQAGASVTVDFMLEPGNELLHNGEFADGMAHWTVFALPDASYAVFDLTTGSFRFYRLPAPLGGGAQAALLQQTGALLPADTALLAQFELANSSDVRKRIVALVHDLDFSDLIACTFWLPAHAAPARYAIRGRTTKAWTNATIAFYAVSAGASGGFYEIDNVTLQVDATSAIPRFDCVEAMASAPVSGNPGPDLLVNGDFSSGSVGPGWTVFGTIDVQVNAGVLEFTRPISQPPAGVVLQSTGQAVPANEAVTATFEAGNSSSVRKRVSVLLHDADFSDMTVCTFWMEPGQPLLPYSYTAVTTKDWTNATISFYPATIGPEPWIRLDNVTLRQSPPPGAIGSMTCGR